MTGFGQHEFTYLDTSFRAELKSLNHRFLECKFRMPKELQVFEYQMRQCVQSQFSRGSFELRIEKTNPEQNPVQVRLNLELAKELQKKAHDLQNTLKLEGTLSLSDLIGFPEVLTFESIENVTVESFKPLEAHLLKAIQNLTAARKLEGKKIAEFFLESLGSLQRSIETIQTQRANTISENKGRLTSKIQTLFEAFPSSYTEGAPQLENRVALELANLMERSDIAEEFLRFRAHLDNFKSLLQTGGPLGRKLEFVLQELGREINTIGSKSQDFEISKEVIEVKTLLEQMREQVMNLE